MAKCPFCQQILSDDWVKKEGASLMGKSAKGRSKRRKNASDAARQRWQNENAAPIALAVVPVPKRKKKKTKKKR
jgi:hypothetical protein